jgi:hypothetical protein
MTNVGQLPVSFSLDVKQLKLHGFTIEPSKVTRVAPEETKTFTITYTTNKKTMSLGPTRMVLPITIKDGLMYHLILKANLTTPDITFSSEAVDFGRVLIGT